MQDQESTIDEKALKMLVWGAINRFPWWNYGWDEISESTSIEWLDDLTDVIVECVQTAAKLT